LSYVSFFVRRRLVFERSSNSSSLRYGLPRTNVPRTLWAASLRSAQDRRPLDVLGLLTYMKAEFSSANEFEFSASLRSAQDRRPLDVLGLLTYMKAEFSSANEFEFVFTSLRSAQDQRHPDVGPGPFHFGPPRTDVHRTSCTLSHTVVNGSVRLK